MDSQFEKDVALVLAGAEQERCKKELHATYCLCFECFGLKQGIEDNVKEEAVLSMIHADFAFARAAGGKA